MANRNTKTNQNEAPDENAGANVATDEVKTTGAAAQDGGDASGPEDHPNPSRAVSDAAENEAAGAAAKATADAEVKAAAKKAAAEAKASAGAAAKTGENPFTKLAGEYKKLYPDNKTFHITSDKQVFLEKNKGDAESHQRSLKEGKVTTVKVD